MMTTGIINRSSAGGSLRDDVAFAVVMPAVVVLAAFETRPFSVSSKLSDAKLGKSSPEACNWVIIIVSALDKP